jgi:MoaA/NifB/PqqE/SkfB family radical SAM enzyme
MEDVQLSNSESIEKNEKKRLDLKVGFTCNNNCLFCAQAHKKNLMDRTTEELKIDLLNSLGNNCTEVIFTGGEPTIRKDIFELVSFAKNIGYELIQVQTNGRMLAYEQFLDKLIKSGVTEFSPALHGHNSYVHDMQTMSKGSFDQTVKGIKNLKKYDQYIISNSVVTKFNYKFLPKIVEFLLNLNVDQFQLAFVHPVGNAMKNFDSVVPKKSDVQPFMREALEVAKEHGVKPGKVMVEAFPFCFMNGYDNFCSELYIPKAEVRDSEAVIEDFEKWRKEEGKCKFEQCKECKFYLVCEGPWKEYSDMFGSEEFKPIIGDKITRITNPDSYL